MCHTPVGSQGQHAVHVSNGCGVFKLLKISMAIPENVSCAMIEPVKITEMQRCCEKKNSSISHGVSPEQPVQAGFSHQQSGFNIVN